MIPEVNLKLMCQRPGCVSRSGYYDWCRRQRPGALRAARPTTSSCSPRSDRSTCGSATTATHGSTKSCWDRGHHVGRHRVARLMRSHGIRACRGRVRLRARSAPPARRPELVDVVRRDFHADVPNAVVVHRHHPDPHRPGLALRRGDPRRLQPRSHQLGHRGPRHAHTPPSGPSSRPSSIDDQPRAASSTPTAATSSPPRTGSTTPPTTAWSCPSASTASPHDNAVMESWFASFKNEELYPGGQPATRAEARARLFDYIWDLQPLTGATRHWATWRRSSTQPNQARVRETGVSRNLHHRVRWADGGQTNRPTAS